MNTVGSDPSNCFKAENPSSIQQMFGQISSRYDLANTVLSFGIHHLWKRKLIRKSAVSEGHRILDCATGTGDLAFLFESWTKGKSEIVATDFCEPMLEVARTKALKKGSKVKFEWADVTQIPFPDQSFDAVSISFGIRNVRDASRALAELGRVVKPGGKVLVLEFGQPTSGIMGKLYSFYSKHILPIIGGWISNSPKAYRYLQTSSSQFPCGVRFLEMAHSTGHFSSCQSIPLFFGVAYLYVLEK